MVCYCRSGLCTAGRCATAPVGAACADDADCESAACMMVWDDQLTCVPPEFRCGDGVINHSRERCDDGHGTSDDNCGDDCDYIDCVSDATRSQCGALCQDGIAGGNESDVDCGGRCGATCAGGQPCRVDSDCSDRLCSDGVCQRHIVFVTSEAYTGNLGGLAGADEKCHSAYIRNSAVPVATIAGNKTVFAG